MEATAQHGGCLLSAQLCRAEGARYDERAKGGGLQDTANGPSLGAEVWCLGSCPAAEMPRVGSRSGS